MKGKRVLCIFAHPDDESFGPGGTLALWSRQDAIIHVLCVTHGEAGGDSHADPKKIGETRTKEVIEASKALGIKTPVFLRGYHDGNIGNNDLERLEKDIIRQIKKIRPDILLTFNLNGVSGHLDHVAVASATTQAFRKTPNTKKLYYFTNQKAVTDKVEKYFVFFPEGMREKDVDEVVDISDTWDTKVEAMYKHKSQMKDIKFILEIEQHGTPKHELFLIRTAK